MKYRTVNGLGSFGFMEAYISDIQKIHGGLRFTLDNVTIYPDNPKNHDIREMRANGLDFIIQDGEVQEFIEEGYKVYDADGNLTGQYEDKPVAEDSYNDMLRSFTDGESCIYSLEKIGNVYRFEIDASSGRTYCLSVTGTGDAQEWDRFLNK